VKLTSLLLFKQLISLEPKFCVTCTHFIPNKLGNEYGKCLQFPIEKEYTYLITGERNEEPDDYTHCTTARKHNNMCGEHGKNMKPLKIYSKLYIDQKPENRG
jgi:hypothetical protein